MGFGGNKLGGTSKKPTGGNYGSTKKAGSNKIFVGPLSKRPSKSR